ncbi:MAG: competence/damage-inducible protein A [Alphaproteobacteria bacterium]
MSDVGDGRESTACIVIIGNEILSGRTKDANMPWLAEQLNALGVRLRQVRIIPDIEQTIIDTINEVRRHFTYVFTTGGIGPTHDDITAPSVAKAFDVPWELHEEAARRLQVHYGDGGVNEARLRMATIPRGATLIDNPISRAPGFRMDNVFVMAGVPAIMQAMFAGFRHELVGGEPMQSRTISSPLAEGALARFVGDLQDRYGDLEVGSYPFFRQGRVGVSIVIRGVDAARLDVAAGEMADYVRSQGETPVIEGVIDGAKTS